MMTLEVQFRIKNIPYLERYLRENSEWYKILTRNPKAIADLEEAAKEKYGLRTTDRIGKILDTVEMLQALMSSVK